MQPMRDRYSPSNLYFGACPVCHGSDGYINIYKEHWFYCQEHKTKWSPGFNLLSSWRDETEAQQRARFNELDFGSYREVKPWCHPENKNSAERFGDSY
jgi:hypothetical protein